MKKATKVWMIVAACLVVAGLVLFTVSLALNQWNVENFTTQTYQTVTHELNQEVSDIKISSDTAKITFLPSSDGRSKVVCYQSETVPFAVTVTETLLTITETDNRKWYNRIGVNWVQPTITVYLPAGDYGFLTVTEHTGDITIPADFTFTSLDISASTANVTCYASTVGETKIHLSTGHIVLENAKANRLDLQTFTGNVTLTRCDAAQLSIATNTGEVNATLLSDKVFFTQTDTGNVNVPKSASGGKCEITTDTGDITVSITK